MKSSDRDDSFKVAIIQHAPVFLNIDESLKKAAVLAEEAANQGAAVIASPQSGVSFTTRGKS